MDDIAGVGKAIEPYSKGAVGLLRRLFGPASTELGEMLADRVRAYRSNNIRRVVDVAAEGLEDINVEELPLRFAIPFIEKASLEDEDLLREMWSNLLIDAAKGIDERHHLILNVLSSLTPQSVELLDFIVGDFYKEDDWYSELLWQEDWRRDFERFVFNEIEPQLFHAEGIKSPESSELAQRVFEFEHAKPYWVFRVDMPVVFDDMVQAVDSGQDVESLGSVIAPISVESSSMQILEREGLLVRKSDELSLKYCRLAFSFVYATPLAIELVATCKATTEVDEL